jgi:hypothetical protein
MGANEYPMSQARGWKKDRKEWLSPVTKLELRLFILAYTHNNAGEHFLSSEVYEAARHNLKHRDFDKAHVANQINYLIKQKALVRQTPNPNKPQTYIYYLGVNKGKFGDWSDIAAKLPVSINRKKYLEAATKQQVDEQSQELASEVRQRVSDELQQQAKDYMWDHVPDGDTARYVIRFVQYLQGEIIGPETEGGGRRWRIKATLRPKLLLISIS